MVFRLLTTLGLCVFLAVSWVAIGMAIALWQPNPLLLITALACLAAAGGIEFSDNERN